MTAVLMKNDSVEKVYDTCVHVDNSVDYWGFIHMNDTSVRKWQLKRIDFLSERPRYPHSSTGLVNERRRDILELPFRNCVRK